MTPLTLFLLLILIVVILGEVSILQRYARAQKSLDQWMDEHGYTVLTCERRSTFRGPFSWSGTEDQVVYYVIAQDATAHRFTGWARCGKKWSWMTSSSAQVEVRWE